MTWRDYAGQHVTLVRFREPENAVRVGSGIAQDLKMADGATQEEAFEEWLSSRMKQLGLDEDVFGSYITGVLDSEDTDEDRKDALKGILDGMTVRNTQWGAWGTCMGNLNHQFSPALLVSIILREFLF